MSIIQGGATIVKKEIHDGFQLLYTFNNGFGASLVKHSYSYGGDKGLYELAVLDKNGELCYDTPITDDVIGHLEFSDALEILGQISRL